MDDIILKRIKRKDMIPGENTENAVLSSAKCNTIIQIVDSQLKFQTIFLE